MNSVLWFPDSRIRSFQHGPFLNTLWLQKNLTFDWSIYFTEISSSWSATSSNCFISEKKDHCRLLSQTWCFMQLVLVTVSKLLPTDWGAVTVGVCWEIYFTLFGFVERYFNGWLFLQVLWQVWFGCNHPPRVPQWDREAARVPHVWASMGAGEVWCGTGQWRTDPLQQVPPDVWRPVSIHSPLSLSYMYHCDSICVQYLSIIVF